MPPLRENGFRDHRFGPLSQPSFAHAAEGMPSCLPLTTYYLLLMGAPGQNRTAITAFAGPYSIR
ncbi:MAG: hypothetical protein UV59_C0029G0026 [Candidatus Gottesmanbacteria bacterium GW2011_GWA1_43_11]|uniref:Uncharacterized protein n=1 Tax=Candidatus Gottesmanbacteria bacterium GW2011_GWA1_43_11 TaxID=1618436 RepID=A0A0G1CES6_9BACT|nr:MAG: hypothetical protein UV59_C0029G0026 [Candidatus Gottesmanbacteria bacterium GW2011_GWA1_43_11]